MEKLLPLDRMTVEEKLRAMEELWANLSNDEAQIESPAWHGQVLQERADRVKAGAEKFMDWEEAKRQLRNRSK